MAEPAPLPDAGADNALEQVLSTAGVKVGNAVRQMRKSRYHRILQREIYSVGAHELTAVQVDILETVAAGTAMRMSDVAEALGVDASTLTRTLPPLIKLELLHRRPDPVDRRAVIVEATPAGEAEVRRIAEARRLAMRAVLRRMPPERIQLMAELLEEYLDYVAIEVQSRMQG